VTEATKVSQRVRGSDIILDVRANVGGFVDAVPLAPGLWEKSRVHVLAQAYSLYSINSMKFTYIPTCETTSAGTVFFGVQTMNNLNISKNSLSSSALGSGGSITKSYTRTGTKRVFDEMKTTTFFPMVTSAETQVSPPVFIVLAENLAEKTEEVGYIKVDYDFTFAAPVLKTVRMSTLRCELSYAKYLPPGFSAIIIGDLRKEDQRQEYERIVFNREGGILSNLFQIGKKLLSYVDVTGLTTLVVDGIHGLLTPSKVSLLDSMNSDDEHDMLAMIAEVDNAEPDEPTNPYTFDIEVKKPGETLFSSVRWTLVSEPTNVTSGLVLPNTGTADSPVYSQLDMVCLEAGRSMSVGAKSLLALDGFDEYRIKTTLFQPASAFVKRGITTVCKFGDVLKHAPLLYRRMEQFFAPHVPIGPTPGPTLVDHSVFTLVSQIAFDAYRVNGQPGSLLMVLEDGVYKLRFVEGVTEGLELVFFDGFMLPTLTNGPHLVADVDLDQADAALFWTQHFEGAPSPPPTPTPTPTPTPPLPPFYLAKEDGSPITPTTGKAGDDEWWLYTRSSDSKVVIGDWGAAAAHASVYDPQYQLGSSLRGVNFTPKLESSNQFVEASDAWLLQYGSDLAVIYAGL